MKIRLLRDKMKNLGRMIQQTIFLICLAGFFLISSFQEVAAEKVPLTSEKISLTEALYRISLEYEVFFSYDQEAVQDIEVNYEPDRYQNVEHALDRMLKGTSLHYKVFNNRYIILYESHPEAINSLKDMVQHLESVIDKEEKAPMRRASPPLSVLPARAKIFSVQPIAFSVSGTVTDQEGVSLIGVNIQVKGSSKGTSTDFDGKFTLEDIDENAVLVISYVGYQSQEVTVAGKSNLEIVMISDSQMLDEVVVVGYGTQRKKDLTGSVSILDKSKMENEAVTGIGQLIQGKLAGVQITQNNGTPYAGSDIKIRGTGSFGASSNPLVVIDGLISNDGFSNLNPNDIEDIAVLKDAASASIYGARGANGVVIVTTKRGRYESPLSVDFNLYSGLDQIRYKIPTLTAKEYANLINDYYGAANLPVPYTEEEISSYGKGTNWIDEISQNGFKNDISLSISGGTKINSFTLSANYFASDGVLKNTEFRRANIRLNNEFKLIDNIKLGINLNANYGNADNTDWGQAINRALIFPPTQPVIDENGHYSAATHHGEPVTMLNPLIALNLWSYDQKWTKLLGGTYVDIQIFKYLNFRTSLNIENYSWYQDNFIPSYRHGPQGLVGDHPVAELNVNYNNDVNYQIDNIVTYSNSFGYNNIEIMAGYTFQETNGNSIYAGRDEFLNNEELSQILNAGNSKIRNSGSKFKWAIQSIIGRANYSYRNKYLFSSSIRVDETSRIAKNNRIGVFPGASVGWVFTEENFLSNLPNFINNSKLRASWGILGNQDIGIYPYQTTLNSTSFYYPFGDGNEGVTHTGVGPTSLGNADIRWEKTETSGFGIETFLFDYRFNFILDFYRRKTSDILVQVPLLATSGITDFPYQNAGIVLNKGIEISIGWQNESTTNFKYSIDLNWSFNRNTVSYIPSPIINNFSRVEEGHSINEWYGYIQEGVYQNKEEIENSPVQNNAEPGDIKFKDLNNDGIIDSKDRTFIGKSVAPHSFGGNINLEYKYFDLNLNFYGQFGALRSIDQVGFAITRGGEQTSAWMYRQRWVGEGTSNYVPRVVAGDPNDNYRRSSFWLKSSDFVRLQNLQLGCNINQLLPNRDIDKLRVYIASQNLFNINSFPGWDPEQDINAGYPIPRSFYLGINFGF